MSHLDEPSSQGRDKESIQILWIRDSRITRIGHDPFVDISLTSTLDKQHSDNNSSFWSPGDFILFLFCEVFRKDCVATWTDALFVHRSVIGL